MTTMTAICRAQEVPMLILKQKQRGMTLTELIVVVAMIGIIALFVTPGYKTYIAQNTVKGAAEGLYSNFILARTTAVSSSQTVTVTFNSTAPWCYGISSGATACSCTSAASSSNCNLGITSQADFPDTTLAISGFTGNAVTFDSARGTLTNSAGYADFALSSGESVRVTINKSGTPQVCSSTVGGYSAC